MHTQINSAFDADPREKQDPTESLVSLHDATSSDAEADTEEERGEKEDLEDTDEEDLEDE